MNIYGSEPKSVVVTYSNKSDRVTYDSSSSESEARVLHLSSLSPLQGCYWDQVKELSPFLSEFGLIKFRVLAQYYSSSTSGKDMVIFAEMLTGYQKRISRIDVQGNSNNFVGSIREFSHLDMIQVFTYEQIYRICCSIYLFDQMLMTFERDILECTSIEYSNQAGIGSFKLNEVEPYFRDSEIRLIFAQRLRRMGAVLQKDAPVPAVLGYIAEGIGHSLLAYKSALEGQAKLQVLWFGPVNEDSI